jgi:hypothetical protein
MILFVLDDPSQLDSVLDAWNEIGVSGVTIMDSTGINRRRLARQVGTTFMAGINRLMSSEQETHYTLFTIVDSVEVVEECTAAVERIVGDLDTPNSGVLAAWPLDYVKGVPNKNQSNEDR